MVTEGEIKVSTDLFNKARSILRKYASLSNFNLRTELQILLDELDGKYKRVKENTRQDLRLFGFYLFNGTIDWEILQTELQEDYLEYLKKHPKVFGQACCVFLNNLEKENNKSQERCAKWIRKEIEPTYGVTFKEWETNFQIIGNDYFSNLRKMVVEISEERFVPHLLDGKYFAQMVDAGASFLEMVFAIWSNVIQIDNNNHVINLAQTEYRVAQWIKSYIDEDYEILPKLEGWETELV